MMFYEEVRETPRLVPDDWKTQFTEALIPDINNDYDVQTFRGTGVRIDDHPLKSHCRMRGCGNCESDNVLVIYAQWSVSVHSGDSYWDYEIICDKCGLYTSRSFSEND